MPSLLGPENPFPGLRPFRSADSPWFFGRGPEINQLLKRLRRSRFLAVVGPSGCGKSSVVEAGLLPALSDGYLDAQWKIACFRPSEKPLDELARSVAALATDASAADIRKKMDAGALGLSQALDAIRFPPDTNILIYVDQFEELFQFVQRRGLPAEEEAKAFLKLLLTTAASPQPPVYVMLTMRVEWLSECSSYLGLAEAITEGIFLVPQMSRRQFQETILNPIEAAHATITSSLIDALLNDVEGRTDQLPLLQHALMRMWQKRNPGNPLTLDNYDAVGRLSRCLSMHAEEIFKDFSPDEKQAAEALFRSITQVVKARKVRRPRPLGEIATLSAVPIETLTAVIEALRQEGRSFIVTSPGKLNEASIIDISHEALMRQWDQLVEWVDAEALVEAKVSRVRDIAAEWDKGGRTNTSLLYRTQALKEAESLKRRFKDEAVANDFLARSRGTQNVLGFMYITAVLIILVLAGEFAWNKWKSNQQAIQLAQFVAEQSRKDKADSDRIAALVGQLERQVNAYKKPPKPVEAAAAQTTSPYAPDSALNEISMIVARLRAARVYLEYSGQPVSLLKTLQSGLTKLGYSVPNFESVESQYAPAITQVRYFNKEDLAKASRLARQLGEFITGEVNTKLMPNPTNLVPDGQLEVWLSVSAGPKISY